MSEERGDASPTSAAHDEPSPSPVAGHVSDAELTEPHRADPWAHRRGEPRAFAVLWLVYLLASSMVSLLPLGTMGLVASDAYRYAARMFLVLTAMGVCVVWPLVRLSQERPARPSAAVLQDLLVMLGPMAVVVLAQGLPWMTDWGLPPVVLVLSVLVGWTLGVGGVLAWWMGSEEVGRPRRRWVVMLGILAASVAGPVMLGAVRESPWSPSEGLDLWMLTSPMTAAAEVATEARFAVGATAGMLEGWGAWGPAWWMAGLTVAAGAGVMAVGVWSGQMRRNRA